MAIALKQIKVYLKLLAIGAVVVIATLVVVYNRKNTVDVWFFGLYEGVNVLLLILITAVASVLVWWGFRKVFGVLREFQEISREKRERVRDAEQQRLARELTDREKRLDEKLRKSLSERPEA